MASSSSSFPTTPVSLSDHPQLQPHSFFTKTVTLFDWWLIRTEKGLGVSGSTSSHKQALRVFSSAPLRVFSSARIVKRYDVFTVETEDGICVVLKAFMNQDRTVQNGFTSQVAKNFTLGFPDDWERYCGQEEPVEDVQPAKKKLDSPHATGGKMRKLNNVPMVSTPPASIGLSNSHFGSPLEERQHPVVKKVTEELGGGDDIGNASRAKRGSKARDRKPEAVVETGRNEERTARKKSKGKTKRENDAKGEKTPASKIKKRIVFGEQATPQAQSQYVAKCLVSPESLSTRRSRSGRILLPVLEFWRNQIPVYDMDRNVTGIQEERYVPVVPKRGSKSEPQKKRK